MMDHSHNLKKKKLTIFIFNMWDLWTLTPKRSQDLV